MGKQKSTIDFYNDNANKYFESTKDGNMLEKYNSFLKHIPSNGSILDFGCGSGRDSKYFIEQGYSVTAIDGSKELCKLASEYIGQDVMCMNFLELNDINMYDGIWACASIIHLTYDELLSVIPKMIMSLKDHGIIYTCFKNGEGNEVVDGKYFTYLTKDGFIDVIIKFNELELIDYYDSRSVTNMNETRYWNNFVLRKTK